MKPDQDISREWDRPGQDGRVCPAWLDSPGPAAHTGRWQAVAEAELAVLLRLLSVYQHSRLKVRRHWVEQQ